MKIPTIVIIALVGVSFSENTEDSFDCPVMDIDFDGGDIGIIRDVASWQACGHICSSFDGCRFWTYGWHDCKLKNHNNGSHVAEGAVSGDKGCP